MKKFKFLPGVLMLVLSIAVLGLGVYAANPGTNSVTGTIKVNAAGNQVEITGYVEENYVRKEVFATKTSRGGIDVTFGELLFDESTVNELSEVPYKTLIIKIQNKSSKALGAYFYNGTDNFKTVKNSADEDVKIVTYAGLMETSGMIVEDNDTEDTEDDVNIASYVASPYAYIAAENDQNTYDCVEMRIRLNLAELHDDSYALNFNFGLNVEEYIAEDSDSSDLLKIADTKTTISSTAYFSPQAKTVVIPSSVTTISDGAFWESGYIKDMSIPNSITQFGGWFTSDVQQIKHITFPSSVTSITNICGDYYFNDFNTWTALETMTILGENVSLSGFFEYESPTEGTYIRVYPNLDGVYYRTSSQQSDKDQYTLIDGVLTIESITSAEGETPSWASVSHLVRKAKFDMETVPEKLVGSWFSGIKTLDIPEGVKNLDLIGCTSITNISIPKSVETLAISGNMYNIISQISSTVKTLTIGGWVNDSVYTPFDAITLPSGIENITIESYHGGITIPSGAKNVGFTGNGYSGTITIEGGFSGRCALPMSGPSVMVMGWYTTPTYDAGTQAPSTITSVESTITYYSQIM